MIEERVLPCCSRLNYFIRNLVDGCIILYSFNGQTFVSPDQNQKPRVKRKSSWRFECPFGGDWDIIKQTQLYIDNMRLSKDERGREQEIRPVALTPIKRVDFSQLLLFFLYHLHPQLLTLYLDNNRKHLIRQRQPKMEE